MILTGLIGFYPDSSLSVFLENKHCDSVFEPSRLLTGHNDSLDAVLPLPVGLPMHVWETREI